MFLLYCSVRLSVIFTSYAYCITKRFCYKLEVPREQFKTGSKTCILYAYIGYVGLCFIVVVYVG